MYTIILVKYWLQASGRRVKPEQEEEKAIHRVYWAQYLTLYVWQLKATHPDGSPATGAKIRVKITSGWNYDDIVYNKTFVVRNGLITDSMDDANTYNAERLMLG